MVDKPADNTKKYIGPIEDGIIYDEDNDGRINFSIDMKKDIGQTLIKEGKFSGDL